MTLVHPDQGFSDRALRFSINSYFCCHQATDIVYGSGGYRPEFYLTARLSL